MKIIEYYVWNKEHPLVLEYGNLKTENGEYIFSTKEAKEKYPGSVIEEKYIKYSWEEYIKRGIDDAESFDVGEYAIIKAYSII